MQLQLVVLTRRTRMQRRKEGERRTQDLLQQAKEAWRRRKFSLASCDQDADHVQSPRTQSEDLRSAQAGAAGARGVAGFCGNQERWEAWLRR